MIACASISFELREWASAEKAVLNDYAFKWVMSRNRLLNFCKCEGGNAAVLFAVLGVLIIGAGGIALDYANWSHQRVELQEAADAGALAGAATLGVGGANAPANAHDRATRLTLANLGGATASASHLVTVDKGAGTVTVSLNMPAKKTLSAVLVKQQSTISALATARVAGRTVACIYALNPTAQGALVGNGSAVLQGINCAIHVNSSNAQAMMNSGTINASNICVVGGYSGSGYSPSPTTGCPPIVDPFASLVVPTPGACTHNNLLFTTDANLNPGVYCGGIKVTGNATLQFSPGTYFIVDGKLDVSSGASVLGAEVVFVLSGASSLEISGSGQVLTTPPTTGSLGGFSIVQEAGPLSDLVNKITGEGRFEFPGIIYLPRSALNVSGRAAGNTWTPSYAAIVADTIKVSGEGDLFATADSSSFSNAAAQKLTVANAVLIK